MLDYYVEETQLPRMGTHVRPYPNGSFLDSTEEAKRGFIHRLDPNVFRILHTPSKYIYVPFVRNTVLNITISSSLSSVRLNNLRTPFGVPFVFARDDFSHTRKVRCIPQNDAPFGKVGLSIPGGQCEDDESPVLIIHPYKQSERHHSGSVSSSSRRVRRNDDSNAPTLNSGALLSSCYKLFPDAGRNTTLPCRSLPHQSLFLSSWYVLASLHVAQVQLLDRFFHTQERDHPIFHEPEKTTLQQFAALLEEVIQLLQQLFTESKEAGSVEGHSLCRVVYVKINRFNQQNNEAGYRYMKHVAVHTRYIEPSFIVEIFIQQLRQLQKISIIRHQVFKPQLLYLRQTRLPRQISQRAHDVDDIFDKGLCN